MTCRVFCFGSWHYDPYFARLAFRDKDTPDFRDYSLGLRLARKPEQRMAR